MISSINIANNKLSGDMCLSDAFHKSNGNIVTINADQSVIQSNKWTRYLNSIPTKSCFPYVTSISRVRPDAWNTLWILGGLSSQITPVPGKNILEVCDMAPTVDYPRIYRSVYAMLKQLRLWIDANKDSLLLGQEDANQQWDSMLNDDGDNNWSDTEKLQMYTENRSREDISGIPAASSIIPEYVGTVALWNHIVSLPNSAINVRLHPADNAGVYIGIDIVVPMDVDKTTDLKASVSLSMSGQSGENLHMWLRAPNVSLTPGGGENPTVSIPGISGMVSKEPSILDNGYNINDTSATIVISTTVPKDNVRTQHVLQCVVEAIPFFICSDNESTYPDSKKSDHVGVFGENVWTIKVVIEKDGKVIQELNSTKKSAYTTVCPDPDESVSS